MGGGNSDRGGVSISSHSPATMSTQPLRPASLAGIAIIPPHGTADRAGGPQPPVCRDGDLVVPSPTASLLLTFPPRAPFVFGVCARACVLRAAYVMARPAVAVQQTRCYTGEHDHSYPPALAIDSWRTAQAALCPPLGLWPVNGQLLLRASPSRPLAPDATALHRACAAHDVHAP